MTRVFLTTRVHCCRLFFETVLVDEVFGVSGTVEVVGAVVVAAVDASKLVGAGTVVRRLRRKITR